MVLIKGGRLYDKTAGETDVLIMDGKIAEISGSIQKNAGMTVINASGMIIAPGLVDMHVHLRDPGFLYKEDILTGAAAAAAGGVTTCCCMPNTEPVADSAGIIKYIISKANRAPVRVLPYGAVTVGQNGKELTDFAALKAAGAVALSDDGNPIQSGEVMRGALRKARENDLVIIAHCEDAELVKNYAVNEGNVSKLLGIPGRPAKAEEMMVERDAKLAADKGARLHIAHVSTAGSVDIIRKAKASGAKITSETCPHYFSLTEGEVLRQGAIARVNPPLRTEADVAAIIEGLCDGTIDVIATDHAPHSKREKKRPLATAPSGMIGLETSLAVTLTHLYHTGKLSLERIIALMSVNPARILGLGAWAEGSGAGALGADARAEGSGAGALTVGAAADIVVFDPDEEWTVDIKRFKSKSRNTPFGGAKLRGKVKYTICRGSIVYRS